MHCGLSQRNVYSDLKAFVFTGSFLLLSLGPAELTLTPFEVCGNPLIRSDALEWVGQERKRELIKCSHFYTIFSGL